MSDCCLQNKRKRKKKSVVCVADHAKKRADGLRVNDEKVAAGLLWVCVTTGL